MLCLFFSLTGSVLHQAAAWLSTPNETCCTAKVQSTATCGISQLETYIIVERKFASNAKNYIYIYMYIYIFKNPLYSVFVHLILDLYACCTASSG